MLYSGAIVKFPLAGLPSSSGKLNETWMTFGTEKQCSEFPSNGFFLKIWDLPRSTPVSGSKVGLWEVWDALQQDSPGTQSCSQPILNKSQMFRNGPTSLYHREKSVLFSLTRPRGLCRYPCTVLQSPKGFQQNFSVLSPCSGDD